VADRGVCGNGGAADRPVSPLVTATELAAALPSAAPPLVLDVRWKLGRTDGAEEHRRAHIPGSVYVDLENELSGPRRPGSGRHPLPSRAGLARAAARWGVTPGRTVVAYDDDSGLAAARLWWVLRWAGHGAVQVLDGGLGAWVAAGGELESGPYASGEPLPPGDAAAQDATSAHPAAVPLAAPDTTMPVLDAAAAARLARAGALLDARAAERYRGEVEPVDPLPGHIPGARSAPARENLAADGRFLDPARLRARFASLGVDGSRPVGVYCGSGVTAAHEVLALALAGITAALYPGSWSEWVADPDRPRALGPEPG
jgi:thiosulfate/3-mercaptopyruvate sulfurtransferase